MRPTLRQHRPVLLCEMHGRTAEFARRHGPASRRRSPRVEALRRASRSALVGAPARPTRRLSCCVPSTRILNKPHYLYRPRQAIRRLGYRPGAWSPAQTAVVTLPWGAGLECWPADASGSAILRTGIYDLLTTEALVRLTDRGDVAVDVGANVGHMTSALAHAAGRSGRVIAFEPHPTCMPCSPERCAMARLRRSAPRWNLHAAAVSDEAGTVALGSAEDFETNRGTSRVVVGSGVEQRRSRGAGGPAGRGAVQSCRRCEA